MAEFLTMDEAKSKFGTKGRTNAGLTLGIIGTALAAFAGNNGGCGCGNGGGILGNLFGGNNNCCAMQAAENAKTLAMAQGQQADNLSWANRVQSMQDDIDLYTYVNSRALATNERIGNESQVLTNQIWKGRVEDLQEKSAMYVDIVSRDNAQNLRLCDELYKRREQDVQEKADLFARLSTRISDLEKKEAATAAALPLMFELNKVNAERYTDACCCKSETNLLMTANGLQRQLDHKIDGQLKYAYSDLCAPVPSIAPLYCSPFTSYGTGMYAVMSDKEIVFQAINKYAKDLASNLFHFNSVASQAVITYVVKNMEDKYGKYLDIFTDVHGNINLELLANAVKAEMKEKSADGFVVNILNKPVRFGEDDVNQLVEIFKTFKQNN